MFKITLPADGSGDGFKLELDGEDITDKISVRKISVDLEARKSLVATMDVYVDEVEAACLAENMTVNVDHSHCTPEKCSEQFLPPLDLAQSYDEILAAWPEGYLLPDVLVEHAAKKRSRVPAVTGNLEVSTPVKAPQYVNVTAPKGTTVHREDQDGVEVVSIDVRDPDAYVPERMKGHQPDEGYGAAPGQPSRERLLDWAQKLGDKNHWRGIPATRENFPGWVLPGELPEVENEEGQPTIGKGVVDVIMGADFASAVDTTVRGQAVKDGEGGNRFHPMMTAGED